MRTNVQAKLSQAHTKPLSLGAFLVGLCLAGISAQAYVISDNFDLSTSGARMAGKTIYGATTMVGEAVWQGTSTTDGMVFGGDTANGYLTANYYGWGYGGGVATVPVSFAPSGNTIKVQLDLYSLQATPTDICGTWIQLGNGPDASSNGLRALTWGYPNPGLFQLFKTDGTFLVDIYTDAYVYDPDGFNTYSVFYDSGTDLCTITANGVSRTISLGTYTPTISFAGISMSPWWSSSRIDNFSVEVIPEPAALTLLAVGGLVLGRRSRCRGCSG